MKPAPSLKTAALSQCAIVFLCASLVLAQSPSFTRACQKWIDQKGYSTDYIEQKTGKRQPGLASEWRGNVAAQDAQPGDVLLIRISADGAQHAALVEQVRKNSDGTVNQMRVSEWNWGEMTDQRCFITENFGKLAPARWVNAASVAYVWRPTLPLQQ